jgi:hypothetical protein
MIAALYSTRTSRRNLTRLSAMSTLDRLAAVPAAVFPPSSLPLYHSSIPDKDMNPPGSSIHILPKRGSIPRSWNYHHT